jgi:hypothetical protein
MLPRGRRRRRRRRKRRNFCTAYTEKKSAQHM